MVVKSGYRYPNYLKPEYPQELQQHKYAVTRDEMLWRRYNSSRAFNDPAEVRNALNILRVIREAPE
jgi:hypothetical protein